MNIEAIRTGIGNALRSFGDGYQISEYLLGNPTGPGFEVDLDPEGVNFDQAMGRGLDEVFFTVRGFVAQATDVGAQKTRDKWMQGSGELSVKAKIEADRTLGGSCQFVRVVSARPRSYAGSAGASGVTYTGVEFRLRVMATG